MDAPFPTETDYPADTFRPDLRPECRVGCAKAYFRTNFVARRIYRKRVEIAFDLISDRQWDRGLDAGTGAGFLLPALASRCREVNGVDLAPVMQYTQGMLDKRGIRNVKLAQADLLHLPFPDQAFELVVCLSVIEHIPDPMAAIIEMARVLRDDGVLILGYPLENRIFTSLETLTHLELRLRRLIRGQQVVPRGKPFRPHVSNRRDLEKSLEKILKVESERDIRIIGSAVYRILKLRKRIAEP